MAAKAPKVSEYTVTRTKIAELFAEFDIESADGEKTKAAAGRARKISNELTKLLKQYRAVSIEHHNK